MTKATDREAGLTLARLHELLEPDYEAGRFKRRVSRSSNARAGDVAGRLNPSTGYRDVKIDGRFYREHRLIWLSAHGRWPTAELDHINGVRTDNRLANLREATARQNLAAGRNRANCLGLSMRGVRRHRRRFQARITDGSGGVITLGSFDAPARAGLAFDRAASLIHGEFARLNNPSVADTLRLVSGPIDPAFLRSIAKLPEDLFASAAPPLSKS